MVFNNIYYLIISRQCRSIHQAILKVTIPELMPGSDDLCVFSHPLPMGQNQSALVVVPHWGQKCKISVPGL